MAMTSTVDFNPLESFLRRVPAIVGPVGTGSNPTGLWWAKFAIDVEHPLAWRVVQEFGHVLNNVSLSERIPTVFMPVSPPPYMNGGCNRSILVEDWGIEPQTLGLQSRCSPAELIPRRDSWLAIARG